MKVPGTVLIIYMSICHLIFISLVRYLLTDEFEEG